MGAQELETAHVYGDYRGSAPIGAVAQGSGRNAKRRSKESVDDMRTYARWPIVARAIKQASSCARWCQVVPLLKSCLCLSPPALTRSVSSPTRRSSDLVRRRPNNGGRFLSSSVSTTINQHALLAALDGAHHPPSVPRVVRPATSATPDGHKRAFILSVRRCPHSFVALVPFIPLPSCPL